MFALLSAFILDLFLGDPRWLPHPVRWMGKIIEWLEKPFRTIFYFPKLAGFFFCISIVAFVGFTTYELLELAFRFNSYAGFALEAILFFYCFSVRSLLEESYKVYLPLKKGKTEDARKALSFIVGRDTENLDTKEISRATIETVAENSVDGFLAPLFYALLGGPVLAMSYKAVNTLDSMVGYKNEVYVDFGFASAKLDDIANYLPARIGVVIIAIAAFFTHKRGWATFRTGLSEGGLHTSPNAGYPEAAFAEALGVQLGGASSYQGVTTEKPTLGEARKQMEPEDILQAQRLLLATAFVGILITSALLLLLDIGWTLKLSAGS